MLLCNENIEIERYYTVFNLLLFIFAIDKTSRT